MGLPEGVQTGTGIRSPWNRTSATAALSQIIRSELMLPDTRTGPEAADVHTGHDLLYPLQEWALAQPDDTGTATASGRRIGMPEVESVRQITATFRDLDNRHGGVLARSAVLAQTDAVLALLRTGTYTETVGRALFSAAADLGSVAGWMTFDAGRHAAAQRIFISALHAAAESGDKRIGAHILQCMARQMSHLRHIDDALDLVALAQFGARRHLTPAATSMLAALEARFHAILGRTTDSEAAAGRALDAYGRVETGAEDPHMTFFDLPELHATLGMAHQIAATHLQGTARTSHVQRSTELVTAALTERPPHRQRSKAFDHLGLARTHLAGGDIDGAAEETAHCLNLLGTVQSRRVTDRLGELHTEAAPYQNTTHGRELREQIRAHLAAAQ
ncbi:transcriptional regulator [Streptomyces olivaceus]|uniref:transcriptional regulator n=1 Tax=Streptomyces olivaceus TaxID=47716 RepID=UPI001CCD250B|nr:transcriptional regulator [Streptomyces olivaceus]MBZ6142485.1 transcriptional regulator [Streptomyces olivaceus]MBZ6170146.1 transcriptional regulator [Streptomyces olivaceus]